MRRECFAEPANVHVDRALLDVDVATPDPVQQLRAAVDAIRMAHEKLEQAVLRGTERDLGAPDADLVASRIELQGSCVHDLALGDLATTQGCADPRQQLARSEWLDDVV